jgi:AraC family transcriptional regulator
MSHRRCNSRNPHDVAAILFEDQRHAMTSSGLPHTHDYGSPTISRRGSRDSWGAHPPGRGTPRRRAIAHNAGVTTFEREPAPRAAGTATLLASILERSPPDLLMVSAQLIEAACRARDGDSDGTRAHITRAVTLLDRSSGPKGDRQNSDRGPNQIPRGGFATWRSRRLAAHVDANLSGKIVIKDLAASLHMSVGHFCRAFKCTFSVSARIWIKQRRIELAQGLMVTTSASLSEIALSCGMSDQSHFSRTFRRIVGETPSSWRQTRHDVIEERATEFVYAGTTKPIRVEKA